MWVHCLKQQNAQKSNGHGKICHWVRDTVVRTAEALVMTYGMASAPVQKQKKKTQHFTYYLSKTKMTKKTYTSAVS